MSRDGGREVKGGHDVEASLGRKLENELRFMMLRGAWRGGTFLRIGHRVTFMFWVGEWSFIPTGAVEQAGAVIVLLLADLILVASSSTECP